MSRRLLPHKKIFDQNFQLFVLSRKKIPLFGSVHVKSNILDFSSVLLESFINNRFCVLNTYVSYKPNNRWQRDLEFCAVPLANRLRTEAEALSSFNGFK